MTDIRVYLVEDHSMIRAGFCNLLVNEEGFEVVGDNGDAREAIVEIGELLPDVILLDIGLPGLSGLDAIQLIRAASPKSGIVMLSNHEGQTFVDQALRAGANGYLSKNSGEAELLLALRAVHRGGVYVSPTVLAGPLAQLRRGAACASIDSSRYASLTSVERAVFQQLVQGQANKEVARELDMSLAVVKKHRASLQGKLDCHSSADLARYAIREGLMPS